MKERLLKLFFVNGIRNDVQVGLDLKDEVVELRTTANRKQSANNGRNSRLALRYESSLADIVIPRILAFFLRGILRFSARFILLKILKS